MIGRRLNRLSPRSRQILNVASVIGREFTLGLLGQVVRDLSEDQLLEGLEGAIAERVIEEIPETSDCYRFTDAHSRETLSGELPTSRREQLHARIGEALEERYGADAESHAAELAYHFAGAATTCDPQKLARYSLLAGEQALQADKPHEALGYFERALASRGVDAPSAGATQGTDADTAALLFGLGRAQAAALPRHQLGEAVESLRRAFNYYRQARDVDRAVAVAAYPFYPPVGHHGEVVQLIDHALELAREQPEARPHSYQEGRLLSRRGMVKGMVERGDYPAAQEDFQQALAIAWRLGDAALELWTLAWAARVDRFHLNFNGCLQKSYRVIELARRVSEPLAELQARRLAANILTYRGDLTSAGFHASAMLELAERRDDHYWLVTALTANERQARLQGRWPATREFSDRGLTRSPMDPRLLAPRALLEYEMGSDGAGEAYLNSFLDAIRLAAPGSTSEYATPAILIPLIARLTPLPLAILNVAEERAEEILSSQALTPIVASVARAGRGLLAVFRNDAAKDAGVAQQQYRALTSDPTDVRGTVLPTGIGVVGDSLLGLLAQAGGSPDQAIAHFENALSFCRRAGCRPDLAWTCYHYAETLRQRNASGDQEQVRSLLSDALDISRELGMQPLSKRVEARRAS